MRQAPFYERFSSTSMTIPRVPIGTFPTPLRPLRELARELGPIASLHMKDDGAANPVYGGNKVRKLELIFGEALRQGASEVMTFGFAGSNHAAATAVHASALGLRSISMLLPQANASYVATNLAVSAAVGAELHYYRTLSGLAAGVLQQLAVHQLRTGKRPFVIAPGGSSPLGTIGFVAAAFELAEQIEQASLPPPDAIYVAFGSCGSAVGLAIGLAAAGLPTKVIAVRVTERKHANARKATKLWTETVARLRELDGSFPRIEPDLARLVIRDEFFGDGYAIVTPEAAEAIALMASLEHTRLDVAYTGKTLACLAADTRGGLLRSQRAVFWNTYNAADLAALTARASLDALPSGLRGYFHRH